MYNVYNSVFTTCVQWDEFSDQMKNVTPYVPYMVCPGNHESDSKNSEYVQPVYMYL